MRWMSKTEIHSPIETSDYIDRVCSMLVRAKVSLWLVGVNAVDNTVVTIAQLFVWFHFQCVPDCWTKATLSSSSIHISSSHRYLCYCGALFVHDDTLLSRCRWRSNQSPYAVPAAAVRSNGWRTTEMTFSLRCWLSYWICFEVNRRSMIAPMTLLRNITNGRLELCAHVRCEVVRTSSFWVVFALLASEKCVLCWQQRFGYLVSLRNRVGGDERRRRHRGRIFIESVEHVLMMRSTTMTEVRHWEVVFVYREALRRLLMGGIIIMRCQESLICRHFRIFNYVSTKLLLLVDEHFQHYLSRGVYANYQRRLIRTIKKYHNSKIWLESDQANRICTFRAVKACYDHESWAKVAPQTKED